MTKPELRSLLAARVRLVPPDRRAAASAALCATLRAQPAWAAARLVCAFLPLPSEPQIAELWAGEAPRAFCFPRVRGQDVELIRIDDPSLLRRATWKLEAAEFAAAPRVAASEVDLFLVPGLGFTPGGLRLGRGGGYYDRLLARRRPESRAIGLCFAGQLVADLPHEPHDQRVDLVIAGDPVTATATVHDRSAPPPG